MAVTGQSKKGRKHTLGVRALYLVLLFLFGVVLWLFLKGGPVVHVSDLTRQSAGFNISFNDILLSEGVTNNDILEQSQQEQSAGAARWVRFYRTVAIPDASGIKKIVGRMRQQAEKTGLTLTHTPLDSMPVTVSVAKNGREYLCYVFNVSSAALASVAAHELPAPHEARPLVRVALVIDDVGGHSDLSAYTSLGVPVTFAILPFERHAKDIAAALRKEHIPYILHLPLEPESYPKADPGPAALFTNMSDDELRKKFAAALASVPGVSGVSNHMGSKFSADRPKMALLLTEIHKRGLFYFDSYTTPRTQAASAAEQAGIPFAENTLFLDETDDLAHMKKMAGVLLKKAKKHGSAAAIGHVQKKHMAEALREIVPQFNDEGVTFVYLTDMVK